MILTKQHLLEILNITVTTQTFYDTLEDFFGEDAISLYYSPMGDYFEFLDGFLQNICHKEWNENDVSLDALFDIIQGRGNYTNLTLEQRLDYLLAGPNNQSVISVSDIEIDTAFSEQYKDFENKLQYSYNSFLKLRNGLLTIICGAGVEPHSASPLASIQRSYEWIFSSQSLTNE